MTSVTILFIVLFIPYLVFCVYQMHREKMTYNNVIIFLAAVGIGAIVILFVSSWIFPQPDPNKYLRPDFFHECQVLGECGSQYN